MRAPDPATVAAGVPGTFQPYLDRWRLEPDDAPLTTRSSRLLAVRHLGRPAMLKIALDDEEKAGGVLMAWWAGRGAAPVLAHDDTAVLLARAEGPSSLEAMARTGRDSEATAIICGVVAKLHTPTPAPPSLVPLGTWFRPLEVAVPHVGGLLAVAWETARELLASPQDAGVLHGDIHHANILDFGSGGWCAIDPKGLWGERGFDYANLFRNPDRDVALQPGRFDRQLATVASLANLAPERLVRWILAVMGLSACWHVADAEPPDTTLAVAGMAAAALGR